MAVYIESINHYKDLSAAPVNWLLANKKDRVRTEIEFNVKHFFVGSTGSPFTLNNTDGYIGAGWFTNDAPAFEGFNIGDTILIFNQVDSTSSTKTIIAKLSDNEVQLSTPFGDPDNTVFAPIIISVTTPITAIKYNWNLKENNAPTDYFSYIDGSEQMAVIQVISASVVTVLPMTFLGNKDYQLGSATIQGVSISATSVYTSRFKLIHYTTVDAITLPLQWDNYLNGINEPYFLNLKCLKFLYKIQAAYLYTDPNWFQFFEDSNTIGNTGDFNENFNTGLTNYSASIALQNAALATIPALDQVATDQTFDITITNTTDAPFSAGNTKIVLSFEKVPTDSNEYKLTGRTATKNFVLDNLIQTAGAVAINGDTFGTSYQVFKTVIVTFTSASVIHITGKIAFGADSLTRFSESDTPRYIISASIQKHSLVTSASDLVTLICDQSEFYTNTATDGLIVNINSVLRHPDYDFLNQAIPQLIGSLEDDIVFRSLFYIDRVAYPTQSISLKTVRAKYKMKNTSTLDEFSLDEYFADLTASPIVGGYQQMNISVDKPFKIPSTEPQKKIRVRRRSDLDVVGKVYFEMIMPTRLGWEYWKSLPNANTAFFDATEANNNLNQEWFHYQSLANWFLFYEFKVTYTVDGTTNVYKDEIANGIRDYNGADAGYWVLDWVKFYDSNNVLLFDPTHLRYFGENFETFKMVAHFSTVDPTVDVDDLSTEFKLEVFEEGEPYRYSSSNETPDAITVFRSVNSNELINNVFTAGATSTMVSTALIDGTLLQQKLKFKVSARIYDYIRIAPSVPKFTEDFTAKLTEAGVAKILE